MRENYKFKENLSMKINLKNDKTGFIKPFYIC